MGIPAVFLYNYFASYLRAIGNSVIPLVFLAVSSLLNIIQHNRYRADPAF